MDTRRGLMVGLTETVFEDKLAISCDCGMFRGPQFEGMVCHACASVVKFNSGKDYTPVDWVKIPNKITNDCSDTHLRCNQNYRERYRRMMKPLL